MSNEPCNLGMETAEICAKQFHLQSKTVSHIFLGIKAVRRTDLLSFFFKVDVKVIIKNLPPSFFFMEEKMKAKGEFEAEKIIGPNAIINKPNGRI